MKNKEISIQTLSINAYCRSYFQRIATMTNGKHSDFNPLDTSSLKNIIEFVATSILDKVGKRTGKS